jgi:cysteine desulfurase
VSTYLDYNATAKVRPEAAAAVARALEIGGNPSSVHAAGRAARQLVETARAEVAALVGAQPQSVVFVSGGTACRWRSGRWTGRASPIWTGWPNG